jgi:hypothetical protein
VRTDGLGAVGSCTARDTVDALRVHRRAWPPIARACRRSLAWIACVRAGRLCAARRRELLTIHASCTLLELHHMRLEGGAKESKGPNWVTGAMTTGWCHDVGADVVGRQHA